MSRFLKQERILSYWLGEEWFGTSMGRGKPIGQPHFLIPIHRNHTQKVEKAVPKWAIMKFWNPSYRGSEKHRDSTVQLFSVGLFVLYTAILWKNV